MANEARDYKVTFEVFIDQRSKMEITKVVGLEVHTPHGRIETRTETFRAYDASDAAKMFEIHAATLGRKYAYYKRNPETNEEECIGNLWLVRVEAP